MRVRCPLTPMPDAPDLPPAHASPWCEVTHLPHERVRVRMGGAFGDQWMASLCTALTDHDLSIEQAHAVRQRGAIWLAEFTLQADEGAEDPSGLPYLDWVQSEVLSEQARVRLREFDVELVEAHGGTICLAVEGDDEIGLVGALLSRLAELHFFPVEMQVATRAGHAEDRLWLSTPEGTAPTVAQRDELVRVLNQMSAT